MKMRAMMNERKTETKGDWSHLHLHHQSRCFGTKGLCLICCCSKIAQNYLLWSLNSLLQGNSLAALSYSTFFQLTFHCGIKSSKYTATTLPSNAKAAFVYGPRLGTYLISGPATWMRMQDSDRSDLSSVKLVIYLAAESNVLMQKVLGRVCSDYRQRLCSHDWEQSV